LANETLGAIEEVMMLAVLDLETDPLFGEEEILCRFENSIMACGSARIVADIVMGHEPEVDIDGLTIARYGQAVAN